MPAVSQLPNLRWTVKNILWLSIINGFLLANFPKKNILFTGILWLIAVISTESSAYRQSIDCWRHWIYFLRCIKVKRVGHKYVTHYIAFICVFCAFTGLTHKSLKTTVYRNFNLWLYIQVSSGYVQSKKKFIFCWYSISRPKLVLYVFFACYFYRYSSVLAFMYHSQRATKTGLGHFFGTGWGS